MIERRKKDLITWPMMLSKAPAVARAIPRVIKGRRVANGADGDSNGGLTWLFAQARQRNPDGPALLFEERRYSYAQLDEWAARVAQTLQNNGLGQGEVVGVLVESRPELLVTVLAVARLGGVSALFSTRDLELSLKLLAPSVMVVGEELLARYAEACESVAVAARLYFVADQDTWREAGQAPSGYLNLMQVASAAAPQPFVSQAQVLAADPCFLLCPRDTPGQPQAVAMSHGRLLRTAATVGVVMLDLHPEDVVYCPLPLYHVSTLCAGWGAVLAVGAGLALRRQFNAGQFWVDTRRFNAMALLYAGELCRELIEQPPSVDDTCHPVRKMFGSGLRPGLWGVFRERFGIEHIGECYGASDGTIGFGNVLDLDNTVGFSQTSWTLVEYAYDHHGPIRGPDGFMRRVAKGREGLLLAKIDPRGALDACLDPQQLRSEVLCDVFERGDRYFNSGDLLRDMGFGHAQFVDRLSDTYCRQGERVSTRVVENLLLRHPQIAEAVVYGVSINRLDGQVGMAAITPAESLATLDFAELLLFAQRWMRPQAVPLFLRIKLKMEVSSTFKYHKTRLREEAFDPDKVGEDPLFAWLPGSRTYVRVTAQIVQDINDAKFIY